MTILWAGTEDIDFSGTISVSTSATNYRSNVRCAIWVSARSLSAVPFTPITSGWLSYVCYGNAGVNFPHAGLTDSNMKGIYAGQGSTSYKTAIWKFDGTTFTKLAEESTSGYVLNLLQKIDVQVINYGINGTVNVWRDGVLVVTYTGDLTVPGLSSFTNVTISGSGDPRLSELIVADEDTRNFVLSSMYPNAAGDANAWTGAYTDIDESTYSSTDVMVSNVTGAEAQVNLSATAGGSLAAKALFLVARVVKSADSVPGSFCLGVKTNGTIDPGISQSVATAFSNKQRILTLNPVTGLPWTPAELNALQLNFRTSA